MHIIGTEAEVKDTVQAWEGTGVTTLMLQRAARPTRSRRIAEVLARPSRRCQGVLAGVGVRRLARASPFVTWVRAARLNARCQSESTWAPFISSC